MPCAVLELGRTNFVQHISLVRSWATMQIMESIGINDRVEITNKYLQKKSKNVIMLRQLISGTKPSPVIPSSIRGKRSRLVRANDLRPHTNWISLSLSSLQHSGFQIRPKTRSYQNECTPNWSHIRRTVVQPSVSTDGSLRTMAFFLAISEVPGA